MAWDAHHCNGKMAAALGHCQDMRSRGLCHAVVARYGIRSDNSPTAHFEAASVAAAPVEEEAAPPSSPSETISFSFSVEKDGSKVGFDVQVPISPSKA